MGNISNRVHDTKHRRNFSTYQKRGGNLLRDSNLFTMRFFWLLDVEELLVENLKPNTHKKEEMKGVLEKKEKNSRSNLKPVILPACRTCKIENILCLFRLKIALPHDTASSGSFLVFLLEKFVPWSHITQTHSPSIHWENGDHVNRYVLVHDVCIAKLAELFAPMVGICAHVTTSVLSLFQWLGKFFWGEERG